MNDFTVRTRRLIEAIPLSSGSFAYIHNTHKALLESSMLPWKPFHQSVGLCLRFHYLMPTKSKSNLKVFFRETKRDLLVLAWQMFGYHGKEWSVAQVDWRGAEGIQVSEQLRFDRCVISGFVCRQFFKFKSSRLFVVDTF